MGSNLDRGTCHINGLGRKAAIDCSRTDVELIDRQRQGPVAMFLDGRFGPEIPSGLTSMPRKRSLYSIDTYFWEGWEDLVGVAGGTTHELLAAHVLVLLKPDAVAGRKLKTAIEWIRTNGFAISACLPVQVSRHQTRALWRYQWNTAPRARKEALDALMGVSSSLLLVLRSRDSGTGNASRRFALMKGPANPENQRTGELRCVLGNRTHLISFVHASDEPADLVREVAILLSNHERQGLFHRMAAHVDIAERDLADACADIYRLVPERDFDLSASFGRLEGAADDAIGLLHADRALVQRMLADIRTGRSLDWRGLFSTMDQCGIRYDKWDLLMVAAQLSNVVHDRVELLIPGPEYGRTMEVSE